MYKLVHTDDVKLDYCTQNVNGIPTPFTIISEDEYRELKYRWHNPYCDFSQVHLKDQLTQLFGNDGGYASAYMDFNDEYGVAEIIKEYSNERVYVKIGCQHEWKYIDGDKFTNIHRCKKCGTVIETPTGY